MLMSVITYYWTEHDAVRKWSFNPENMVDGDIDTFAMEIADGVEQHNTTNTCPGTDLGVISEVVIRVYSSAISGAGLDGRVQIGDSYGNWLPFAMPPVPPGWSPSLYVTTEAPFSDPPLWSEIKDLICHIRSGSAVVYQVSKVELIVTYTPTVAKGAMQTGKYWGEPI